MFTRDRRRAENKTLEEKILTRVARSKADVFVPRDFEDLGGYTQIIRALRKETEAGRLVKLGYGVYAKAKNNPITGKPMLTARDGFTGAARQALSKLGVRWEPDEAEVAYNAGQSTQIPVMPVLKVNDRFARKLSYKGVELICA
jgi:hypothetical protein